MRCHQRNRPVGGARSGKILALLALMLPMMLGLVGLTLDGGMMMASHRQTANVADAAALAAAMDKFRGASNADVLISANNTIKNNGLKHQDKTDVTLSLGGGGMNTLNIPPTRGPYAGDDRFVEVIIEQRVLTSFIHVVGVNRTQRVGARAVAGFEPVGSGEGAIVLDRLAAPGIAINGQNTMLKVKGTVVVNSTGSGVDQYGDPVSGITQKAITTGATPSIVAQEILSVGGIDNLDRIRRYDEAFAPLHYNLDDPERPFFSRMAAAEDPLASLPIPTQSNGVLARYPQYNSTTDTWTYPTSGPGSNISVGNNQTRTIPPGIYQSISITGGNVTFQPGIYVVGAGASGGGTRFNINGGVVGVQGGENDPGIMIYNTGSNYLPDGSNDAGTGELNDPTGAFPPPKTAPTSFGGITVNGGNVTLRPYVNSGNSSDPFNGMLFYQRRWNSTAPSVGGNSDNINLAGVIYAKWAPFSLAGSGRYNAQYIVGSLSISGNAVVTISGTGKNFGKANQVFLVE